MSPGSSNELSPAAELFAAFLDRVAAGDEVEFETLCAENAGLESELRRLHTNWGALFGDASSGARRLRDRFGDELTSSVDLGSAPGPDSSSDLLDGLAAARSERERYELTGEIARGGMGAILRAWDGDLRRATAMKVLLDPEVRPDSRALGRFLDEAQITAQLEHPGIVPVHELGLDATGRVYFTMQLVRGRHLGEVLDAVREERDGWTIARALGVLLNVCEAMAYAHSRGVVHRDLKPQNVMVGSFAEVYVMDWGLARVVGREGPDTVRGESGREGSGLLTEDGQVVGTPVYMAPEQARGDIDAIGPGADVYAVGAMLYELLVGRAPYLGDGEEVSGRVVLERVLAGPPPPLTSAAPDVAPELEAVCEKAMARDVAGRYGDMRELADDLRAYLELRVVRAYRTGALIELRKWVQRNRALAAACAAAVLALIAGLATSLWQHGEAVASAELAEAEADRAAREAEIAEQVSSVLIDDLIGAAAPNRSGRDVTLLEAMDTLSEAIEGHYGDTEVERAVESRLRLTLGGSYYHLGKMDAAMPHLERAAELAADVYGPEHVKSLQALNALATWLSNQGRHDRAIAVQAGVAAAARRDLGERDPRALVSRGNLGRFLDMAGRSEEAEEHLAEVARLSLEVHGEGVVSDPYVAHYQLGDLYLKLDRYEDAVRALELALEGFLEVAGDEGYETMLTRLKLGETCMYVDRPEEAVDLVERAASDCREKLGPEHVTTVWAIGLLGVIHRDVGDPDEAELYLFEACEAAPLAFRPTDPALLEYFVEYGELLLDGGRVDEAVDVANRLLDVMDEANPRRDAAKAFAERVRVRAEEPAAEGG